MNLLINATEIKTDDLGRFSLNDLHKAAGGEKKYEPNRFMRTESFKNVLAILEAQNKNPDSGDYTPMLRKVGKGGGTWVCEELVYKYAMWVNAEFEVKVIQTFRNVMKSSNPPATMEALNELTRKIESDKDLASKCGHLLAHYKKVKKENEESWLESVREAQLTLGFVK